jgi:hypothetical protein
MALVGPTPFHPGQFLITGTGSKSITGLGFQPTAITFRVPSGWADLDESTKDTQFSSKPQGNAHGFARLNSSGQIIQQSAGSYGGQSNSNNSRMMASSTYGIQFHIVDTNGGVQSRGWAKVTSMDSDGFTIQVDDFSHSTGHRIFFEAYRTQEV